MILSASAASTLVAQPAIPQPPSITTNSSVYEFRPIHNRDGIGKFYHGREIAQVMGHEAADWLERPERNKEENTELLVEKLAFRPGQVIADIGAGTGYYSRRIARHVAPSGKVLAVDIQPEMLDLLNGQMKTAGITNVVTIQGTTTDPRLPEAAVDLALLVDVYHEFDFPHEMTTTICRSLKPGGRLVLVEFRGEDAAVPIKPLHKMTEAQVKKEMSDLPLIWRETKRDLPWQHILIFEKTNN